MPRNITQMSMDCGSTSDQPILIGWMVVVVENAGEDITLEIDKEASTGTLDCFVYLFMEAQIGILKGEFMNITYGVSYIFSW